MTRHRYCRSPRHAAGEAPCGSSRTRRLWPAEPQPRSAPQERLAAGRGCRNSTHRTSLRSAAQSHSPVGRGVRSRTRAGRSADPPPPTGNEQDDPAEADHQTVAEDELGNALHRYSRSGSCQRHSGWYEVQRQGGLAPAGSGITLNTWVEHPDCYVRMVIPVPVLRPAREARVTVAQGDRRPTRPASRPGRLTVRAAQSVPWRGKETNGPSAAGSSCPLLD